jgi:tetratricopeptide (TPR) repeat protein
MRFIAILLLSLVFSVSLQAQRKKKDDPKFADRRREAENLFGDGMRLYMTDKFKEASTQFEKAIETDAEQAGSYFMISKIQAKSDLIKATETALKATEFDPENRFYTEHLAELYTKQNDFDKAAKLYEILMKKFPADIDNMLELANLQVVQSKFKDAIDTYNKVEKQMGITEEIINQKRMIYLRLNKLDEALKEGEKLIASEPKDEEFLERQAQLLVSFSRFSEAEKIIARIREINPDSPEAHVMMAEIYRKKGDTALMEKELNDAFANQNLGSDIKVKILQTYMMTIKPSESLDNVVKLCNELIKMHPKEARGYVLMGDLQTKKKQKPEARNSYVKAAKLDRASYEVWMAIMQLDNDLNEVDSLATHADLATEFFPNQPFFWYNSGFAHYAKRRYEKAKKSLEEARNLSTDQKFESHVNSLLGDVYNSLGQHDESDEAYEAVLAIEPEQDHVLNNYSYFLSLRNKNLDKAEEMSSKLALKFPTNATYLDTHAWVLFIKKDYENALKVLEQAIATQKNVSGTIIEHYGDALFKTGNAEKALEQWKKAKSMGETSDEINKKIQNGKMD